MQLTQSWRSLASLAEQKRKENTYGNDRSRGGQSSTQSAQLLASRQGARESHVGHQQPPGVYRRQDMDYPTLKVPNGDD